MHLKASTYTQSIAAGVMLQKRYTISCTIETNVDEYRNYKLEDDMLRPEI
jgi:hypothetical protein